MTGSLDTMFNPKSVAVVGASNVPGKWGFLLTLSILFGGFRGKIYPVNPRERNVLGLKAYPALDDVPGDVDLAMVAVIASMVPEVLRQCAQRNIRNAVVVSSNFSEVGGEGIQREAQLVQLANELGMNVVGPNTMGIASPPARFYAVGAPIRPRPGPVALISQSGNLGVQLMTWGEQKGLGFSRFVGTGNEAQLRCQDFLHYFGQEPQTRVVAMYLEGIDDGQEFIRIAQEVSREKPIVVLKVGKTGAGEKAALSHSGALAGRREVVAAALQQAGVIEAETTAELVNLALAFSRLPVPRGRRVGIMTMGGGWGVVTADACAREGLEVPELAPQTVRELDGLLPSFWSRRNPVDMVGTVRRASHYKILETLAQSDAVDSIISLGTMAGAMVSPQELRGWLRTLFQRMLMRGIPWLVRFFWAVGQGLARSARTRGASSAGFGGSGGFNPREMRLWSDRAFGRRMRSLIDKTKKPIVAVTITGQTTEHLSVHDDLVVFSTPEDAARALSRMARYGAFLSDRHSIGLETTSHS